MMFGLLMLKYDDKMEYMSFTMNQRRKIERRALTFIYYIVLKNNKFDALNSNSFNRTYI